MNSNLRSGFQLQEQSFALLFKNPDLLLYWAIPTAFVIPFYFLPSIQLILDHPHLRVGAFWLIITFVTACFIKHLNNRLEHRPTSVRSLLYAIITIAHWIVVWGVIQWAGEYALAYDTSNSWSALRILKIVGYFVWNLITFCGLVVTILERKNPIAAFITSATIAYTEFWNLVTGRICIALVYYIIGALLGLLLFVLPENSLAITIPSLLLGSNQLIVVETFKVLLYRAWQNTSPKL